MSVDPYIQRAAAIERTKARHHLRLIVNRARRDLGLPTVETELLLNTTRTIQAAMAALRGPMAAVANALAAAVKADADAARRRAMGGQ